MTNQMDIEKLRALHDSNSTAKALFSWFASRQRGATVTKVRVASKQIERSNSEIVALFKSLEGLGAGKFLAGRKGMESRIEWLHDVKSLSEKAVGQLDQPRSLALDAPLSDEELSLNKHQFMLRQTLIFDAFLPPDLNSQEADRLANWIKTLPFD